MAKDKSFEVLLVTNYNELDQISELATLLDREGHSYDIAVGREEALSKIKDGLYKAVYFPSSELDLGTGENPSSERMPPEEDFNRTGYRDGGGNTKRTASMFETVRAAREKDLGVVVADDTNGFHIAGRLRELGAVPVSLLSTDEFEKYQTLAEMLR